MKFFTIVLICATLFHTTYGGHLLALHFVATGSYIRIMNGVLETLATENQITLYSIVHKDFDHPNVTVIKVTAPPPKNFFFGGLFEVLCDSGIYHISSNALMSIPPNHIDGIFADQNVKKLISSPNKFDALITFTAFSEFTLQFADLLKIPLIQISATVPFTHINDAIGNPPFLTTVNSFFVFQRADSFMKRVQNYLYNLRVYTHYSWLYMPWVEAQTKKYFPPGTRTIESMNRNTSLMLTNTNNALGLARPNMPNVIEIGGIYCRAPLPLPSDLEEFISGSGEHGIIYISFGSSIRSKFPDYITQAIVRVLRRLPQRILWKWNDDMSDVPPNVMMSKWFSQQDVLGHNKTRLFITQSGMFSMHEAAYHSVPVLAIPIAFDQPNNAFLANDLGYCEYIYFCDFTEEKFYSLIQKMISDPTYKQNVNKVSKLMRDFPVSQKQLMLWWVDYIVRHRGNPQTDTMVDKSYGFKRLDVDVLLFLFICTTIFLFASIYLIYKSLKCLLNLRARFQSAKEKAS